MAYRAPRYLVSDARRLLASKPDTNPTSAIGPPTPKLPAEALPIVKPVPPLPPASPIADADRALTYIFDDAPANSAMRTAGLAGFRFVLKMDPANISNLVPLPVSSKELPRLSS